MFRLQVWKLDHMPSSKQRTLIRSEGWNTKSFDALHESISFLQGIETVRRDTCLLVRNVIGECLDRILVHRDISGALTYVRETISDLLTNKLDLSLLVLSKVVIDVHSSFHTKTWKVFNQSCLCPWEKI